MGYLGCFSVVQNSTTTIGPVSWLILEAGLSVMRLAIWAWNPTEDDAPPLEIILELDKCEPLPTCNKCNEEILEYKVLPLTRARDFLKIITSFAGLIEPFINSDLSLYYTLTRNWHNEPENAENHKLGERTLYITVFDHKERTTRVYTRNNELDTFYSTKLDAPLVDVGHYLLEVEIDSEIDPKGDPVSSNRNILHSLRNHHQLILEHIQYRLGAANVTKTYAINNRWTMKIEDTISTLQKSREENGDNWKAAVEKGREKERTEESLASDYFMHSSIERERRLLDEKRVDWIARRMEMISKETKERFQGEMGVEHRVNKQAVERKPETKTEQEIEEIVGRERYYMEMLLIYEVRGWEQLFWNHFKAFLDQIDNDRVEEKERLRREWRANCWRRLDPQMHAAVKRLAGFDIIHKDYFLQTLGKQWALSISQLFEGVGKPDIMSLSELSNWSDYDEILLRMEKEVEDTEFRLKRGSDLGRFDQFWDDGALFNCRYSQSKWFEFSTYFSTVPVEVYSHALKGNKNIIHIAFSYFDSNSDANRFQAVLCDSPWVTSISWGAFGPQLIPAIYRDLLFVKFAHNDLNTFAEKTKLDPSTYIFSDVGCFDLDSGTLWGNARVLISFVAPTPDESLILRIKHSGERPPLEVTLGSTEIQLNPSSKQASLTIDDITLNPIQVQKKRKKKDDHQGLSFEPEIRNNIFIRFRGTDGEQVHLLHDIELLDEGGLEYMPRSASLSQLSN